MSVRLSKSTAFAPVSPSRTRLTGYEYHAFPVDHIVCDPVVIGTNPSDTSVDVGGDVTFAMTATGAAVITYQWAVSTDAGATWSDITDGGVYSGAVTNTLVITGATSGMSGYQYMCNVANGCSTASTEVASLIVNSARLLVVAGGGAGGKYYGGGGGGGAVIDTIVGIPLAPVTVTVGLGGVAPLVPGSGLNGGNSSFGAVSRDGGGGGGGGNSGTINGNSGGNGGGMGGPNPAFGGAATMGFKGGDGNGNGPGGGGGASEAGATGGAPHPGHGGMGLSSDISGTAQIYGSGGGGSSSNEQGPGGTNAGTGGDDTHDATIPVANFGGGGGGGSNPHLASNGATGVVIFRYAGAPRYSGGTITTVGTDTVHTFTTSGTLTPL